MTWVFLSFKRLRKFRTIGNLFSFVSFRFGIGSAFYG